MADTFEFSLDSNLGLAKIKDAATGITTGTTLSSNGPNKVAMSLARFSRSSKEMDLILSELRGKDEATKLENIAINYGHASVAGMAHTNFYVEGASILDETLFFYRNSLLDGQGRSTRYQDYSKARYLAVPSNQGSESLRKLYKDLVLKQLSDYSYLVGPTKTSLEKMYPGVNPKAIESRTCDCVKYLLPLGIKTSFGAVISARELSNRYISYLLGSKDPVSTRISQLLLELMTKENGTYKPEVGSLLRHAETKSSSTPLLVEVLSNSLKMPSPESFALVEPEQSVRVYPANFEQTLVTNIALLLNPLMSEVVQPTKELLSTLGQILFRVHTHHNEMGPETECGPIVVRGMADLGSIKDLNRHRSINRFVPLLHEEHSLIRELDREPYECFYIPPYVQRDEALAVEYEDRLEETYHLIKSWYSRAISEVPIDIANYYTKRLLPHAHATQYVYSASIPEWSYLTQLRVRNGGHIQYRLISYEIMRGLASLSPLFQSLVSKTPRPRINDIKQFEDRG